MFYPSKAKQTQTQSESGFTLIEMMVVIAIFVIITAIVLSSLPRFRERTRLDLVAQEVALLVRQAQTFTTSTRAFGSATNFPSYGVYFKKGDPDPDTLILFADKIVDKKYNGTACGQTNSECLEQFTLPKSIKIAKIISPSPNCPEQDYVHISFVRPETDAYFVSGNAPHCSPSSYEITLQNNESSDPATKTIHVWNTGHIYVD